MRTSDDRKAAINMINHCEAVGDSLSLHEEGFGGSPQANAELRLGRSVEHYKRPAVSVVMRGKFCFGRKYGGGLLPEMATCLQGWTRVLPGLPGMCNVTRNSWTGVQVVTRETMGQPQRYRVAVAASAHLGVSLQHHIPELVTVVSDPGTSSWCPGLSLTGAATATHSNKMQGWTGEPRKSRSLRKNVRCRLGIEPKAL